MLEQDSSGVPGVVLPPEKCRKLSSTGSKEVRDDESILDSEVESIVGLADSSQLEVLAQVQGSETLIIQLPCIVFIHKYCLLFSFLAGNDPP